ncbi:DUF945 domain-containing protein [bacterium]|nr:MAG: DUF945 domain-containing protein [bacterium]
MKTELAKWTTFAEEFEIRHGPLPLAGPFGDFDSAPLFAAGVFDGKVTFDNPPEAVSKVLAEPVFAMSRAVGGFGGGITVQWAVVPFTAKIPKPEATVEWKGISGDAVIAGPIFSGSFKGGGLVLTFSEGEARLGDIEGSFDLNYLDAPLFFGKSSVGMAGFEAKSSKEPFSFSATAMKIFSERGYNCGLLDERGDLSVELVKFGDFSFGPAGEHFAMKNIDYENFMKLFKEIAALAEKEAVGGITAQKDADPLALIGDEGWIALKEALSKSPELENFEIWASFPKGKAEAKISAAFDGKKEISRDIASIARGLSAKVEARVPAALADEWGISMALPVQPEGGAYVVKGEMKNGEVFVNGAKLFSL